MDTETTGLKKHKHEILEIALISYVLDRDGNEYMLKEYSTKIKPVDIESADDRALEINGYTEEEWVDAPRLLQVIPEIKKIINETDVLLGQNLIFDMQFLNEMCRRNEIPRPKYPPYVDTKSIADRLVEKAWLARSGMDYLCEHYNVEFTGRAHTALTDCQRTMEVWKKLLKDVGGEYDVYTFKEPYDRYKKKRNRQ